MARALVSMLLLAGTCSADQPSITTSDGEVITFDVDPFKKHCLLEGLDDIGLTLEKGTAIDTYEDSLNQSRPWV